MENYINTIRIHAVNYALGQISQNKYNIVEVWKTMGLLVCICLRHTGEELMLQYFQSRIKPLHF